VNAHLDENKTNALEQLLKEYMDILAWTYKDLRRIPNINIGSTQCNSITCYPHLIEH
jgi:hypothetical protein